jgi:hypothetical protein
VIPRHDLPEDAADWSAVAVSLPRLDHDAPDSCPCSAAEIFEYVQMESADVDRADPNRLVFLRTAQVGEVRFWLWFYTDADGEEVFVTCRVDADGSTNLGLASRNGLNAEQFLLAEYYDEVYWP